MVEWEHKSKNNGKMHACGHLMMFISLCFSEQLNKDQLKGTVQLVFQPAEEGRGGAYHMLQGGALDKLHAIFGLHVEPELPTGSVGSRPGPMLAASRRFVATIQGKGGHAARPHDTRDHVLAAAFMILAIQQIISRETDPLEPGVVSVTFIEAGQVGNVILETVRFWGTLRNFNAQDFLFIQQRIREIIETQAAVHRCSATLDFMEETMRPNTPTVNDKVMYEHAKTVGESLLGDSNVHLGPQIMGAEDFGFYTQKMPVTFFFIGTRNESIRSPNNQLHSPYLFIDEDVLPIGAAFHAAVAISYLNNHLPLGTT